MPKWVTGSYQPGDLAIFDFTAPVGDCAEHTGFVESVSGSVVTCIEGNTSDKVSRKTRYTSQMIGAYRPDYTSTMTADKVLTIARGEIGYAETGDNYTKYGKAYGLDGNPWCVMFEWWCFKEAGMSALFCGGGKVADCGSLRDYAKKGGTSSGSSSTASTTAKKISYCTPKVEIVQSTTAASAGTVKSLQCLLNAKGFVGADGRVLTIDGEWGTNTAYAVGLAQKKLGLTVDKSCGADTWSKLIQM